MLSLLAAIDHYKLNIKIMPTGIKAEKEPRKQAWLILE